MQRLTCWFLASLVAAALLAAPATSDAFPNGRASVAQDLASVSIPGNTAYLSKPAAAAWNTMRMCAVRDGVDLYPGVSHGTPAWTAYRNIAAQVALWRAYKSGRGALAAVPGTSNHGYGRAVDLALVRMRTWINGHGRAYGWAKVEAFSEWWHVNYVGGFTRPDPGTSQRFPNLRTGSGGPCQGPAVREAQRRLGVPVDGEYGRSTARAARRFERDHHLPADGRVESRTWLKLRKLGRGLRAGRDPRTVQQLPGQTAPMAGVDVKAVQGLLNSRFGELGRKRYRVKVTGELDRATVVAIRRFQRLRHLPVTGKADDRTYAELLKKIEPDTPKLHVTLEGTNLVADFEGERLCPYRDVVGVWTIGFGHTAGVGPRSRCLSHAEAVAQLHEDLDKFGLGVTRLVHVRVTVRQFNAVTSWAFNVGLGAAGGSTLIRVLNDGRYAVAANEFLKWDRAGGRVLAGLSRRRSLERQLYLRGSSARVRQRAAVLLR